jgi:hypothetical protein
MHVVRVGLKPGTVLEVQIDRICNSKHLLRGVCGGWLLTRNICFTCVCGIRWIVLLLARRLWHCVSMYGICAPVELWALGVCFYVMLKFYLVRGVTCALVALSIELGTSVPHLWNDIIMHYAIWVTSIPSSKRLLLRVFLTLMCCTCRIRGYCIRNPNTNS